MSTDLEQLVDDLRERYLERFGDNYPTPFHDYPGDEYVIEDIIKALDTGVPVKLPGDPVSLDENI